MLALAACLGVVLALAVGVLGVQYRRQIQAARDDPAKAMQILRKAQTDPAGFSAKVLGRLTSKLGLGQGGPPMDAKTSRLRAEIRRARPGQTLLAEPGAYGRLDIEGVNPAGPIVIRSKDPGNPAIFEQISIRNSSNIRLSQLTFFVNPQGPENPFSIVNSRAITLSQLDVHGSLDSNAADDRAALLVRDSAQIRIEASQFHQLWIGIGHLETQGLTVEGNYFHEIRTDGIRGGGSSHVLVAENFFTDFTPIGGDHPDAIQFWTRNTKASARDITVRGNVVTRGAGAGIQGVFFRDQTEHTPYQDVVVTGNIVVGGGYNGIAVGGVQGLEISHNVVAPYGDQKSWIRLGKTENVTLSHNTAADYLLAPGNPAPVQSANKTIGRDKAFADALLDQWLTDNAAALPHLPAQARGHQPG